MTPGIQIIDPEERFTLSLDGSSFVLRRLDGGTKAALERRVQQRPAGSPPLELTEEILDYVLVDWQGVTSPLGGAEVPCSRDNKLKLPVPVKLRILAAAQAARAEDQGD